MKKSPIVVGMILGATLTSVAFSQESWLILDRSGHYTVAEAVGDTLANTHDMGHLISYAQSPQAFALVSRQADGTSVLNVLDQSTGQITRTFPINAYVIGHMSSPIEDLVFQDDAVYFVSMHGNDRGFPPNVKGGRLDLNRMALADGTVKTFPLPPECHTSRMLNYNGIPLIYAWNGFGVWKFDTSSGTLKRLTDAKQMADIFTSEEPVERARLVTSAQKVLVGPFSDDVAVPSAGVFRLSKAGVLQKILDANLNQVGPGRPSVALGFDLGADGQYAQLTSGTFNGSPAIGALGTRKGSLVFEYINPGTLEVEWTTTMPSGTVAGSLKPTADGIAYVDPDKAQIAKSSVASAQAGTAAATSAATNSFKGVWNLRSLDPSTNPYDVRILTLKETD